MYGKIKEHLQKELQTIEDNGIFKKERHYHKGAEITISTGETVLNFCSNNYLGLSSHQRGSSSGKDTLDTHGFGCHLSVLFVGHKIFTRL
jgi:glycine C-acetyltransferase